MGWARNASSGDKRWRWGIPGRKHKRRKMHYMRMEGYRYVGKSQYTKHQAARAERRNARKEAQDGLQG